MGETQRHCVRKRGRRDDGKTTGGEDINNQRQMIVLDRSRKVGNVSEEYTRVSGNTKKWRHHD